MKNEYLFLHRDIIFKDVFGTNKNIKYTQDLLEKFFKLEKGSLDGMTIENSVVLDRETVKEKKFELDVLVKTKDKSFINLEMQTKLDDHAEKKNFLYVARLISQGLNPGENYDKLKPVTGLEFSKEMHLHKDDEKIKRYCMTNVKNSSDRILEDLFNVYIIDVEIARDDSYNEDDGFEMWRRLIGADTIEEVEELASRNPLINEAKMEMERFMGKEYVQDYAREETLQRTRIECAREEGLQEGHKEGLITGHKEEKIEIAKSMILKDMSTKLIHEITKLSIEEIEKLRRKISDD